MKKLLYLSCHSIAEYDEIRLLDELGFEVYSHGAYTNPAKPGDPKRPGLPITYHPWFEREARQNPKEKMSREFLKKFDVIFSHWKPEWIVENYTRMSDKLIILRTNGQSSSDDEVIFRPYHEAGVKIVRYSPIEETIPMYCGHDAIIRFYKDPKEWKGWTGKIPRVITIGQSMIKRDSFCNWTLFDHATADFSRKLYGPENEEAGADWGGCVPYDKLRQTLRDSRCYFYTGTHPASYTLNFIEAWMTGIPIVAIGPKYGNQTFIPGQKTYEVDRLITSGKDGFVSDDIGKLHDVVGELIGNKNLAALTGNEGRKSAIRIFGKETIKKQWEQFFRKVL